MLETLQTESFDPKQCPMWVGERFMQTGSDITAVMIPVKNTAPSERWVCVPSWDVGGW